jgi:bifunctional DNA-binding transcriptional regulator/antitoxin component of YhaV-PrlF toxin-antitoxin module
LELGLGFTRSQIAMDRITIIDSSGHVEIPEDIRSRHGLEPGTPVQIEERGEEVIISHTSAEKLESISDLAGILSAGDPVDTLLKERALDKIREDEKFRLR